MTNREEVEHDEQNPFRFPAAEIGLNRLVAELAAIDQNLSEIREQEKQLIRDRAENQRRRYDLIAAIRKALPPGVLPDSEQKAKSRLTLRDAAGHVETVEVSGT